MICTERVGYLILYQYYTYNARTTAAVDRCTPMNKNVRCLNFVFCSLRIYVRPFENRPEFCCCYTCHLDTAVLVCVLSRAYYGEILYRGCFFPKCSQNGSTSSTALTRRDLVYLVFCSKQQQFGDAQTNSRGTHYNSITPPPPPRIITLFFTAVVSWAGRQSSLCWLVGLSSCSTRPYGRGPVRMNVCLSKCGAPVYRPPKLELVWTQPQPI